MKVIRYVLAIAFLLGCFPAFANPILFVAFNELAFMGNNWTIEMHTEGYVGTLDGRYLRSNSGTALFKNGIHLYDGYTLITQDSLMSPLSIDALGDSVAFGGMYVPYGTLSFGNTPSAVLPGPRPGQSISFGGIGYYYLDNSPTLGSRNDSTNAMGTLRGLITDSLGQPILGVRVSCLQWSAPVYSDSTGRFTVRSYSHRCQMTLTHANCSSRNMTVQIWPESTVTMNVMMDRIVSVKENPISKAGYALTQSYPNPFNPVTNFQFSIANSQLTTLRVYDISGREVATLVSEVMTQGEHSVTWDASGVASGIYFYRLVAGNYVQTRKMVLAK